MNCPKCGCATRPLTTVRKVVKGYDHQMIYRHNYRECISATCQRISYTFSAHTTTPIPVPRDTARRLKSSLSSSSATDAEGKSD